MGRPFVAFAISGLVLGAWRKRARSRVADLAARETVVSVLDNRRAVGKIVT